MNCELVRTTTRDGLRLDGAYVSPTPATGGTGPVDAVLVLHGLGGNFYGSPLLERLARWLSDAGVAVLVANTRGHDTLYATVVRLQVDYLGAARELVADCLIDIASWLHWLEGQGHARLALAGHSLGAIKSLYALAHQSLPRVVRLAAISPSRLSYAHFMRSEKNQTFSHWLGLAHEHVATGQGKQLLQVDFPFPTIISAEMYVDKYGPEERYNWLRFIDRITVDSLLVFGQLELKNNASFVGVIDELSALPPAASRRDVAIIDGADHFYSGQLDQVAERVTDWLTS
jgi:dienelactone hydrolase